MKKTFKITVLNNEHAFDGGEIGKAISLSGYSHCGAVKKIGVSWYPFEAEARDVFIVASNQSQLAREIRSVFGTSNDRLWPEKVVAENPARIVARKFARAREICMAETQRGDFSRVAFFQHLFAGKNRVAA